MRIALVTAQYPPATIPCGVGDYTRWMRRAFEELSHQCLVVTSSRTRSVEKDVYALPGRWGLSETLAARRLLISNNPDAVIFQYTPEHYGYGMVFKLLPLLLRRASSGPLVLTTFHTLVGGRGISKANAVLMAAGSHGVISIHPELTCLFRRRLPWWSGKLREIPIGANLPAPTMRREEARKGLRENLGLRVDTPVLGTFGFPAPGKGFETLIQALSLLNGSARVHLACVGETRAEDRAYKAELEGMASRMGVQPFIHWLGELPEQEAANVLSGTDAYVVPYDEGASLRRGTLMAGFRAGVPVITTTPRYADPSLRHQETILAVPPGSPQALADCIGNLLVDAILWEHLRQKAAKEAVRFEWRTIAAQHVEFLHQLKAQKG
jgi:glycosyltransferase involved in cell wall biosynthesis